MQAGVMKGNIRRNILMGAVISFAVVSAYIFQNKLKNSTSRPNIIIVVIDALRPDHLGCYGYNRAVSPYIDNLANAGLRFSQAISAAGNTGESVPSLLTGTYPPTHQIRDFGEPRNPSVKTLAQELEARRYHCILWTNHEGIASLDIWAGFKVPPYWKMQSKTAPSQDNAKLTDSIVTYLKSFRGRPFFFYIHYFGVHPPYNSSLSSDFSFPAIPSHEVKSIPICGPDVILRYKGEGCIPRLVAENGITDPEYYISKYDKTIVDSDIQIGRLVAALKECGLYKNTAIIIMSDHGEMLGEHDTYFNHAGGYEGGYEELIRIPLILKLPSSSISQTVVSGQVSSIDVAPTILELTGLPKPSYMQGESLLEVARSGGVRTEKYVCSFFGRGDWVVLRGDGWKLIRYYLFDSWKLFNLTNDSHEKRTLVTARPDKFNDLTNKLTVILKRVTFPEKNKKKVFLSSEEKEILRSLGYLQ